MAELGVVVGSYAMGLGLVGLLVCLFMSIVSADCPRGSQERDEATTLLWWAGLATAGLMGGGAALAGYLS